MDMAVDKAGHHILAGQIHDLPALFGLVLAVYHLLNHISVYVYIGLRLERFLIYVKEMAAFDNLLHVRPSPINVCTRRRPS